MRPQLDSVGTVSASANRLFCALLKTAAGSAELKAGKTGLYLTHYHEKIRGCKERSRIMSKQYFPLSIHL